MKAAFSINNLDSLKRLESKIKSLPVVAESVINDNLHNKGSNITINEIKRLIPVSSRKKTHAAYSDSLRVKKINLGFIIENTPKFWYLQFPELGIGNSYLNQPEEFMNRGINVAMPKIIDSLENDLKKEMEEKI